MEKTYNLVAGRSLERIGGLSDGVFAIAMTLIVLDVRVPSHLAITTEAGLAAAIVALAPQLVTYLLSFLILGIFWVGQAAQLEQYARSDRDLTWIKLAFLAAVATMPFTTHLLAEFITFRLALVIYWLNMLVLGALLYVSWRHAERAGLIRDDAPPGLSAAIVRRIVIAQTLYAVSAALCVISTYLSIGLMVGLQLYYAIAPRWRPRAKVV
jgi:uncharacterized membrane protein